MQQILLLLPPPFTAKYRNGATTTLKSFFSSLSAVNKHSAEQQLSLFRRTPPSPYAVSHWNDLIKRSISSGDPRNALHLFDQMRSLGWVPDGYTYPFVLKACGDLSSLNVGASVHLLALVTGHIYSNVHVGSSAITMYGRCGAIEKAQQMFDEMLDRGVFHTVSWNSIIALYVQSGEFRRALQMFEQMISRSRGDIMLRANGSILVNVLQTCVSLKSWRCGMEIHGHAVRRGLIEDVFVGSSIVNMYAKLGSMDEAKIVFDLMEEKNVVSWTALVNGYSKIGKFDDALRLFERMRENEVEVDVITWSAVIAGYAQRGFGYDALDVFREMIALGIEPTTITIVSVLSGCAAAGALVPGKETHCYVTKKFLNLVWNDPLDERMVISGLINMYAKCNNLKIARAIFDSIGSEGRSVGTWTGMIGGYAQHGEANDALGLFSKMLRSMMPSEYTISCALVACARLGDIRHGREIHTYALRNLYENDILCVSNCLIKMYAESGDVNAASVVFDNMAQRSEVSWISLIKGYGMHGCGEEALQVFNGMIKSRFPVDGLTLVVVLYACSHSGMVEKGINYFNDMSKDFGIVPEVEHYGCMVDLLGRAGRLDDAMKVIKDMPMEPDLIAWSSLLSGCRLHGNVELGEHAVKRLLEFNMEKGVLYTLLSNIYARAGRWKDVAKIRLLMKHTGIPKRPGCSWVQGKKGTATFFVEDRSHPLTKEIYNLLDDLIDRIKIMGYVPETSFALFDVDDEEKMDIMLHHSEKLALAYGILTTAPGLPIRVIKNLRVCGDCHTAITYISMIIEHEVIMRDTSRFHHFKNGVCSCKGYW